MRVPFVLFATCLAGCFPPPPGQGPADAGSTQSLPPADSGAAQPPADSGLLFPDAGISPPDASRPSNDSGVATSDADSMVPDAGDPSVDGGAPYHPAGYRDSDVHGPHFKLQTDDCRTCHANDLTGARGDSCDSCHEADWRTNCTYCHGGTDNTTGAPPRDLSEVTARDQLHFRAHTEHLAATMHPAYDCNECHVKPADLLGPGHLFDSTPGVADVTFGGLSGQGTYSGNGTCDNLYCHGSGRAPSGSVSHTMAPPTCSGCHPFLDTPDRWGQMSGKHSKHLDEGLTCNECHGTTVNDQGQIVGASQHVDGQKQFVPPDGITRSANGFCNGRCHNQAHLFARW